MEKIVFTISRVPQGIKIRTESLLADEEDKWIHSFAVAVLGVMERLTMKYNTRDISVLFEVE